MLSKLSWVPFRAREFGAGWMDVNEIRAREALPPKIAAPQPEGVNNEA